MTEHDFDFEGAVSLEEIASVFLQARRTGQRLPLLSAVKPELTLAMAEQIAALTTQLSGAPIVGYKLGYTSQVMRAQMGIESPNWGVLTADMDLRQSSLPVLAHPRVEPEIALVLRHDLSGDAVSIDAVRSAVGSVHLALEIVDTRYRAYRFTLEDNTADGSSAAAFALGATHDVAAIDHLSAPVVLLENDRECGTGRAAEAMGGPLNALQWLARSLADRGRSLKAGMVVLTGGLTQAVSMQPMAPYKATQARLGETQALWAGAPQSP